MDLSELMKSGERARKAARQALLARLNALEDSLVALNIPEPKASQIKQEIAALRHDIGRWAKPATTEH